MDLKPTLQQQQAQQLSGNPILGIDVYHGDGAINWKGAFAAGYRFAWIKASEGETVQDERFHENREQARDANVITAPYHFFRPKTAGQKQIDNFLSMCPTLNPGDLPAALDLEAPQDWKMLPAALAAVARAAHIADWKSIAVQDRVAMVLTWLEAVHQAHGMRPIIYASPSFVDEIFDNDPRLAQYLLWIANYNVPSPTIPAPWTHSTWWQFSEHGHVPQITSHDLDLNRFEGTMDDLRSLCFQGVRVTETAATTDSWTDRCPFLRWLRGLFRS
jgi:lysozyme